MSTPTEDVEGQRIAALEEALGITSEMPQQVCAAGKQPKEPMVRMTLPLFHRRKTMLIAYHSGHLNPLALRQMAIEFECTEAALLDDLEDRANWEQFIWANQEAHEDGKALLNQLQLAREEALFLMKTCKSANARVGAIGKFIDSIKAERCAWYSSNLISRWHRAHSKLFISDRTFLFRLPNFLRPVLAHSHTLMFALLIK